MQQCVALFRIIQLLLNLFNIKICMLIYSSDFSY